MAILPIPSVASGRSLRGVGATLTPAGVNWFEQSGQPAPNAEAEHAEGIAVRQPFDDERPPDQYSAGRAARGLIRWQRFRLARDQAHDLGAGERPPLAESEARDGAFPSTGNASGPAGQPGADAGEEGEGRPGGGFESPAVDPRDDEYVASIFQDRARLFAAMGRTAQRSFEATLRDLADALTLSTPRLGTAAQSPTASPTDRIAAGMNLLLDGASMNAKEGVNHIVKQLVERGLDPALARARVSRVLERAPAALWPAGRGRQGDPRMATIQAARSMDPPPPGGQYTAQRLRAALAGGGSLTPTLAQPFPGALAAR